MAHTLTDHESIKRWADMTGAKPAHVKGTGGTGDPGLLRLDFEGYSGGDSLEEISWSEWFRKFDESHLALIVDDTGRTPNFNKLVRRDDDGEPSGASSRRSASTGRHDAASSEDGEDELEESEDDEFDDEDEEDDENEESDTE